MKTGSLREAGLVLVLALSLAGPAPGQAVEPGAGAPVATAPQAAPAAPATFRDVIRLHEAGLSDEFILRKIGREGFVYHLSTEDIIACKTAGLPEPIIEAMLKTAAGTEPEARVPPRPAPETVPPVAPSPAPHAVSPAPPVVPATPPVTPAEPSVAPAAPAPAAAPSAAFSAGSPPASPAVPPAIPSPVPAVVPLPPPQAADAPSLARQAERSWEGMVRRAPGVVLFRPPWEPGRVSFREERLAWVDATDAGKKIALPASEIREHFLVCPKDSDSDGDCFEWGVKTADGEHRFRDAAWERARSAKPLELFEFLRAIYPDLPTARYRAKKR